MAIRTYKDRILIISIPLIVMLSGIVVLIYLLANRSVTYVINDSLDRTAQLFESHLKLERSELEQFAKIISGDVNIQEYLFLINNFDSGRDILPDEFNKSYGGLHLHNPVVLTRTGEIVYGQLNANEWKTIKNLVHTRKDQEIFFLKNDDSIESAIISPVFHKQEFVGAVVLSTLYDQLWLDKMQKKIKGLLFIEKARRIVRSTNPLLLGETLSNNNQIINAGESVYQLYPVINLSRDVRVALWYGVSITEATQTISNFISMALFITCIGIAIIIIVSYFITRNFEKPLSQLNNLINEIINGKLPVVEKLQENNEIDFLRNKFVDMVSSLREKEVEVKTAQKQLQHNAITDALTGALNRRAFEEILQAIVTNIQESEHKYAVCYIDLDQFKIVNDTCGHDAGNELLMQLTSLIRTRVRKTDTFARLGGDEFGLIILDTEKDQAITVAESILTLVKQYKYINKNKVFTVGASIGLVMVSTDTKTSDEVLTKADIACYTAKNKGRNRIIVYEENSRSTTITREQLNWTQIIKEALRENRFELWSQAIVPATNSSSVPQWFEILLRMHLDDGEIVIPGAFLPTAERYDLMPEIDKWVIKNAFEYITLQKTNKHIYSINLSALTINDIDNIGFIKSTLNHLNIDPQQICFEIAETAIIRDLEAAHIFVDELKILGVKIAIDDFGLGLSTTNYLASLDVDFLKIGGNFVADMDNNEANVVMVEAIQRIATLMKKQTVAVYVKNKQLKKTLEEIGVNYLQGYYIEKPKPLIRSENLIYQTG